MNSIRLAMAALFLSMFGLVAGCAASSDSASDDQEDENVGVDQSDLKRFGAGETCPAGEFYCAFIGKCISTDLKCPSTSVYELK